MRSPHLYNRRVKVERRLTAKNSMGGREQTLSVVHADIAASIQSMRDQSRVRINRTSDFGTEETPVSHRVYTPTDVSDVEATDIVTDLETGAVYQVLYVRDEGDRANSWCIYCRNA